MARVRRKPAERAEPVAEPPAVEPAGPDLPPPADEELGSTAPEPAWVRGGAYEALYASGVTRVLPDGARVREEGADLPVVVDLRAGGLGVVGPCPRVVGVLAAAVAQVTALHAPGGLDHLEV